MATPTERGKAFVRQWEILNALEDGPRSLSSLAANVGDRAVTTRTIRRDLEVLEAARFPVYTDTDEDGIVRWRLLSNGVTPARRVA